MRQAAEPYHRIALRLRLVLRLLARPACAQRGCQCRSEWGGKHKQAHDCGLGSTHRSCDRSHSSRFRQRSSTAGRSSASFFSRAAMDLGGMSTLEYVSASAVKNVNMECVGFRKLNCGRDGKRASARAQALRRRGRARACGFMCSRLVRPVRKLLPLRATNCAVSLMTSRSKAAMPSGSGMVYCSCARAPAVEATGSGARTRGVPHLLRRLQDDGLEVRRQLHSHLLGRVARWRSLRGLVRNRVAVSVRRCARSAHAPRRTSAAGFAPPDSSALKEATCGRAPASAEDVRATCPCQQRALCW